MITTAIVIYDWIQEKDLTAIYEDRHMNDDYRGTADVRERIAPIFVRIHTSITEVLHDARADLYTEFGDDLTQTRRDSCGTQLNSWCRSQTCTECSIVLNVVQKLCPVGTSFLCESLEWSFREIDTNIVTQPRVADERLLVGVGNELRGVVAVRERSYEHIGVCRAVVDMIEDSAGGICVDPTIFKCCDESPIRRQCHFCIAIAQFQRTSWSDNRLVGEAQPYPITYCSVITKTGTTDNGSEKSQRSSDLWLSPH